MPDRLAYTVADAVKIAAVSRSELYRAFQQGTLALRKRGRRSIILADDLRRWLQSLPTASTSKAA